jgi:dihydroorotate dehydrogenase
MFRRLPGTLAGGLRRAPARVAQQARFNSTKPPVVEEPVVRNTGTKRPARWIGTTFAIGTGALLLTYYYDTRSVAHEHLVMPVIRAVADAEDGHKIAIKMLSAPSWARPQDMGTDGPELQAEVR